MTREEAVETLKENFCAMCAYGSQSMMSCDIRGCDNRDAIKALEQEPKTGHWMYTLEDWNKWECSECGYTKRTDVHVNIGYKFCPKCGARMEGGE